MALTNGPTLIQLAEKGEYVIDFTYDFSLSPVTGISIPNSSFPLLITYGIAPLNGVIGSKFSLNSTSFQGVQNLPPFRNMSITVAFATKIISGTPVINTGGVFANMKPTNQWFSFSPNFGSYLPANAGDQTNCLVSASVDLNPLKELNVDFYCMVIPSSVATANTDAKMNVTFSTKKLDSYSTQGMFV